MKTKTGNGPVSAAAALLGQRGGKGMTPAKRRAVRRNLAKANRVKAGRKAVKQRRVVK